MKCASWPLAALLLLCTHAALAQSRVVVRPFSGQGAARAREAVVSVLSDQKGVELVAEADAEATAGSVGADLDTSDGRVAVARKLTLSAFVTGEVRKHGRDLDIELTVIEGKTGALLDKATLRARPPALPREVRERFMRELGAAVFQAQPPPAEEPAPAPAVAPRRPKPVGVAPRPATKPAAVAAGAEPTPEKPPKVELEAAPAAAEPELARAGARAMTPFELGAGLVLLMRDYSYNQPLIKLAEHSLSPTPAFRLDLRWYPGAHFTHGAGGNIGIDLFGQVMWPVDAKGSADSFKTSSLAFGGALRYRIPLGDHQLGIFAGYGQQTMSFAKSSSGVEAAVPDVAYGSMRFGADARLLLGQALALKFGGAYLLPLGYGQLADKAWFPHVSGGGIEAMLGLGYLVSDVVELDLGLGFTRYFMSLNPALSDPGVRVQRRIAGGLSDQFFSGSLGVTLRP